MYKNLCIAAALLWIVAATVTGTHGSPSVSTSPQIVAKGSFLDQNAPITAATIFTPARSGVYRVSAYAVITRSDSTGGSIWDYALGWSDGGGLEVAHPGLYQYGNKKGGFLNDISVQAGGPSTTIAAIGGVPITLSIDQIGTPDNSAYSLFYVVEQI